MTLLGDIVAQLLFLYAAVVVPARGRRNYRRLEQSVAADRSVLAVFYRRSLIQWGLAPLIFLAVSGRAAPLRALGLAVDGQAFLLIGCVGVGAVVGAAINLRRLAAPQTRARLTAAMARAGALLPASPSERRLWAGVAVTAGVCEELLFRSFLLYYFSTYTPWLPWYVAVIASASLFGLAHLYQGNRGAIGAGALGLGLAMIYLLSGSIVPAMLLHAYIDLQVLLLWRPESLAVPAACESGQGSD